ncbi:restriction endonuclease subunit S [Glaesserella parasuis]|nr:restriction endonuclease subunit S [Glaesserella parasuis]
MSSWTKYKLEEVVSFSQGFQISTDQQYSNCQNGMNRFIRIVDYTNPNEEPRYIKDISPKYWVNANDVVMIRYGSNTAGKVVRGFSGYIANNMFKVNVCDENFLNKEFLYYFLSQPLIYEYLMSSQSSSTMPAIKFGDLYKLDIFIPPMETQLNIVDYLNVINDKIQLNTQINQTLEQIAQTIFKSWFIDFDPVHAKANARASGQTAEQATQAAMTVISGKNTQELHRSQTANPEQYQQLWEIAEAFPSGFDEEGVPWGWEQTTLSEVCSMKNGYAFKSSDWTEEGIPVIKIGSVKPMIVEVDGNGFVDEEHSVLHSEFLLTEGDIVVGLTGYVGEVGRIPQGRTAMLNQRVAKFIPNKLNEQQDYYSFVYCLVRDKSFKAFAETNAKGSAQANISTKELLNYSIILASSEIQMKFESLIKPLLDKILVNSGNNENLSKVRDLLLPKLLSGELNGLPEKTI